MLSARTATTTRRHHAAGADRQRHGDQQGLRRHDRGDRRPLADRPASAGDDVTVAYTAATLRRQERRHRQAGDGHGHLADGRRRRQLHAVNTTATTTADITAQAPHRSAPRRRTRSTTARRRRRSTARPTNGRRRRRHAAPAPRATFADKNVGTAKTVTRQRDLADRRRRGQLHPQLDTATTTADITALRRSPAASPPTNKIYDGTRRRDRPHQQPHWRTSR